MTFPEIAVLLDDGKPQAGPIQEMSDQEYARYWSSMTPKERLEKVAERKRYS